MIAVVLTFVPGSVGCADTACGLSCGSGVTVWWEAGELPDAQTYNLCVNGECEERTPRRSGDESGSWEVSPSRANGGPEVEVRLELVDADGTVLHVAEGGGTQTGECCWGIELRVADDGLIEDAR